MRTLRSIAIGTASVIVLGFLFLLTADLWVQRHMIYPSRANESAFLRNANFQEVVKPFIADGFAPSIGSGTGAGAGMEFVTHTASFDEFFTMQADREGALIAAIDDDVSRRLVQSGALILTQTGDRSAGFHFDYATANTIGSVSIQPLAATVVRRNLPLPNQLQDVALKIEVSEKSYPKGLPAQTFARLTPPR